MNRNGPEGAIEPSDGLAHVRERRPVWSALVRLEDLLDARRRVLLHAGPPFESAAEIPKPVLNSLVTACIFEGWASNIREAAELVEAGEVELLPAQDLRVAVPLCGVASPSMALIKVEGGGARSGTPSFAVLNEGQAHALRLGVLDASLPAHHRWLNDDLADWLADRLTDPIELYPALGRSLAAGDDGHSRTVAGSACLVEILLDRAQGQAVPERVREFLLGAPAFALNVWMALSSYVLCAAAETPGAGVVSCAGANGVRVGIKLLPSESDWTTTPAPVPAGDVAPSGRTTDVLPAVGDSPLVECFALGGMALARAPDVQCALAQHLPPDALERGDLLFETSLQALGGVRALLSARRVTKTLKGPLVVLGMIDKAGEVGRVGGGVVELPVELFAKALAASE
jgi:hypothetical protein